MMGRIKLAWWREALERLDRETPPAEPVLQDAASHLLPLVSGAELAAMEEGWAALADPDPLGPAELDLYARRRGGLLFRYAARILGAGPDGLEAAGERWALVDLARHCASAEDADVARAAARLRLGRRRWPGRLRALGMLDVLAARDLEPGRPPWEARGSPARMLRMLGHRLTGL